MNSHPESSYQDDETVDDNLTSNLLRGSQTTARENGRLSLDYAVVPDPDQAAFFVVGRVFKLLWVQPLGQNAGPEAANVYAASFGEALHAKIQRFVVVKPKQMRGYSNCVQISTNGGKGATKIGLRQGDHAIAYTSAVPPPLLPEERYLNKDPIRINPVNQTEKLDALSRINLGKVYPVEHNVKVCNVGMVDSADIRKLTRYYKTGLRNDLKG